jgi:hypothetical protein
MRVNSQEPAASAECNNRDARGVVSFGFQNTASGCPPRRQREEEGPQEQQQQQEAADEPPSTSFFLCLSRTQRKRIRYTIIRCTEFAVFCFFSPFLNSFSGASFFSPFFFFFFLFFFFVVRNFPFCQPFILFSAAVRFWKISNH